MLARKSNKSEKLHKKLMSVPGGKALTKAGFYHFYASSCSTLLVADFDGTRFLQRMIKISQMLWRKLVLTRKGC